MNRSPPKVYFYCCTETGNLQEDIIALAEGLKDLGVPYYASDYYWRLNPEGDWLFSPNPGVHHSDCDIVVLPYTWPLWVRMGDFARRTQQLPNGLFVRGRRYHTVFMDNFDGYQTESFGQKYRNFDVVLRSKYNERAYHPSNTRPWAYGLVNRYIDAASGALPFKERKRAVLYNFGASHPFSYNLREWADREVAPKLSAVIPIGLDER